MTGRERAAVSSEENLEGKFFYGISGYQVVI